MVLFKRIKTSSWFLFRSLIRQVGIVFPRFCSRDRVHVFLGRSPKVTAFALGFFIRDKLHVYNIHFRFFPASSKTILFPAFPDNNYFMLFSLFSLQHLFHVVFAFSQVNIFSQLFYIALSLFANLQ